MSDEHGPVSRIYLARHGRTALNAEGRLRGLADPALDATGEDEARSLAVSLSQESFTVVLSSPLRRAVRTAEIMLRTREFPTGRMSASNDRDYGPWTGHVTSEVVVQWGSVDAAPGVESVENVLTRVLPALESLVDPGAPVVIVTHDAVMRPLIAALDPTWPQLTAPTASWNELINRDGRWTILRTDQK